MHLKPSYTARKARKPRRKPLVTIHYAPPVLASLIASVESRWNVTLAHKESRHAN